MTVSTPFVEAIRRDEIFDPIVLVTKSSSTLPQVHRRLSPVGSCRVCHTHVRAGRVSFIRGALDLTHDEHGARLILASPVLFTEDCSETSESTYSLPVIPKILSWRIGTTLSAPCKLMLISQLFKELQVICSKEYLGVWGLDPRINIADIPRASRWFWLDDRSHQSSADWHS